MKETENQDKSNPTFKGQIPPETFNIQRNWNNAHISVYGLNVLLILLQRWQHLDPH